MDLLDWVERLGGWGAFLLGVWWFLQRFDRLINLFDKSVANFSEGLKSFQEFEKHEEDIHNEITATQRAILEELREIRRERSEE